jgi:hypothetical protein
MPPWTPKPVWRGQDAFIIGGGPSLQDFDWSLLVDENTIGCNNAFRLGPDVCKICVFVDRAFIFAGPNQPRKGFYDELAKFPNLVVTNDTQLKQRPEPWMKWMPRKPKGLFFDALGYNHNCGASAVNLALLFGATTVYLLGFDMHLDVKGHSNWHTYQINKATEDVYARMIGAFGHVRKDLVGKFPGCRILNVTKDSSLKIFPELNPDIFWLKRRKEKKDGRINQTNGGVGGNIGIVNTTVDSDSQESAVGCKIAG